MLAIDCYFGIIRNDISDRIFKKQQSNLRFGFKKLREQMKLYWVTTEDHDEDWFVVASSPQEASKYHVDMEGYDPDEAKAEEVLDIPENLSAEIGWPSDELLFAVGAKFLINDQYRVVEIDGKRFCEGMLNAIVNELNDDLFEEHGEGRLNQTKKPSPQ